MINLMLFPEVLAAAVNGWLTAFLLARAPREPINRVLSSLCFAMFWWGLCFSVRKSEPDAELAFLFGQAAVVGWIFNPSLLFHALYIRIHGYSPPSRLLVAAYAVPVSLLVLQVMPDPLVESLGASGFGTLFQRPVLLGVYNLQLVGMLVASAVIIHFAPQYGTGFRRVRLLRACMTAVAFLILTADALRQWMMPYYPPITPLAIGLIGCLLMVRYARTGRTVLSAPSAAEEIMLVISYAIIVSDLNGKIRICNPAAFGMLGYPEDELLAMNLNDLVIWNPARNPERFINPTTAASSSLRADMRMRDGNLMPVIATESMVRNAFGTPLAVILVASDARDVLRHEQERASIQALRESEERFRSLIENASDLIAILDGEGRMRYLSPSIVRMLGWTPQEALDAPIYEFIHGDDKQAMGGVLRRRVPASLEIRLRHKDGTWRYLAATATPITHEDTEATIVNARDVTERKRLEMQLTQAQKMEAIGRLAGGVAHDFNNMLTAIKGYTDLLLADSSNTSESLRADLSHIRNAANRAAMLTQQLLAFSRRQVMAPRVIDLNGIALDMESLLQRMIGEDIELRLELDPELSPVLADPSQIQQVVMNLVVNARDAMPKGGRLTLETANTDVRKAIDGIVPPGSYVRFSVSDTGQGMSGDVMSHIFEPFFTTKEAGHGTGLGLATVYGVVKQSGGYILVNSVLGKSSTFHIYLPCVEGTAEPTAAPTLHAERRGSETILLVEDEPDVRRVARRSLERHGYQVLEAESGTRALEISNRHEGPIHLLLTDVVMPQMSGLEVADQLAPARPDMIVLFMSGYSDTIVEARRVESDHFLSKPFTPSALQNRVREVLDNLPRQDDAD